MIYEPKILPAKLFLWWAARRSRLRGGRLPSFLTIDNNVRNMVYKDTPRVQATSSHPLNDEFLRAGPRGADMYATAGVSELLPNDHPTGLFA
jgi:hypothetical protein